MFIKNAVPTLTNNSQQRLTRHTRRPGDYHIHNSRGRPTPLPAGTAQDISAQPTTQRLRRVPPDREEIAEPTLTQPKVPPLDPAPKSPKSPKSNTNTDAGRHPNTRPEGEVGSRQQQAGPTTPTQPQSPALLPASPATPHSGRGTKSKRKPSEKHTGRFRKADRSRL